MEITIQNGVMNPHYDSKGRLEGGWIIVDGVCIGHADPCGEEGAMGVEGITEDN